MSARSKLKEVAAFEFRYQAKSPLFLAAAALFFLTAFFDMAMVKLVNDPGGTVLFNSPHAIIKSSIIASLLFMFVGAAIVSNAVNRDVQTGFGPLIRATGLHKRDYLIGRFVGAFAVSLIVLAAAPLGAWLGTLMPFADAEMIGPNRLSGYAAAFGLFALPNALVIAAILFALATSTRSTAGTFFGVLGILIFYLVGQRLMEGEPQLLTVRTLADPLGMASYMASARYLTAAEINAGTIPVTDLMLMSRLLWVGLALGLLGLTYARFNLADRAPSRRAQRRLARRAAKAAQLPVVPPRQVGALPAPRFGSRAAAAQFFARCMLEARFIVKSPAFLVLLIVAFVFTLPGLLGASGMYGTPLLPTTAIAIPIIEASFRTILIVVAAFYGGELVWRERERRIHEIVDATPLPAWGLMLPKLLGLTLVLWSILLVGLTVGILAQTMEGAPVDLATYFRWYLLPNGVDALTIAALAVFVQALSPGKYVGWGVMVLYMLVLLFGPALGLAHPMWIFGRAPDVVLSGMTGAGNFGPAAWWLRLFWAAIAVLLLVAAQLLWRRGTESRLKPRLSRLGAGLSAPVGIVTACAILLAATSGAWIVYNTLVLNSLRGDQDAYLAAYEKRYLQFARLPQPTVRHVALDVAIYPAQARAEARGRYRMVNDTGRPIKTLHLRLLDRNLELVSLDVPGARIERNDKDVDYRIYRFNRPMAPGETRTIAFHTRRQQRGFRAAGVEDEVVANGSNLTSIHLLPRIGMSDVGMIEAPATRREFGLPERRALPRLDDLAATRLRPSGDVSWIKSDITVSTAAGQHPLAPGIKVEEAVSNGRRVARFVTTAPIKFDFAIFSGRYAVARQRHGGVDFAVYYDPSDGANVDRMMRAMTASIDYFGKAFGPYPFGQASIVEHPYGDGGHANPTMLALAEQGTFAMDMRNPGQMDMVTMVTAHEFAHQWWGHQVAGARMQGGAMLYESLAQYSALMMLKKLQGEDAADRFLAFQQDRYLSGRRTALIPEEPLAAVEISQGHISYGKGALALYQLQQRIGEVAMNRALKRFVDRYRFTEAPYPRSLDLIALFRQEAGPQDQALITDLFERITLWDMKVETPTARRRADGRWDVTVPVAARKIYADGKGREHFAPMDEWVEVGLFAASPDDSRFTSADVIKLQPTRLLSGRQIVRFVTQRKPAFAAVDPHHAYIERVAEDNLAAVGG